MGLHVLRGYVGQLGFIVGAALTFNQTVGLLFAVWCLGIAGWFATPWLGGARPALRLGLLFAVLYVASHILPVAGLSPALAALAAAAWLWLLPALAGALGRLGRADRIAPGVLAGLAGQAALQTATHGLDLPLMRGLGAGAIALGLAGLLTAGLVHGAAGIASADSAENRTPGWGVVALAPYLVLQMVLLTNIPQVSIWTGWSFAQAALLVLAGLAAGALVLLKPTRYAVRVVAALAGVLLLARPDWFAGAGVWLLVPAQACLSLALPAALHPHRVRFHLAAVLAALLFFGIYFEYHTRPGWTALWPLMAGLAVLPALLPLKPPAPVGGTRALGAVLALGLVGVGLGLVPHGGAAAVAGPAPDRLKAMTYNVHEGYSDGGVPDPEAVARVVEQSGADLVGLQEIARGLDVLGGADLAAWLQWRLPAYHLVYGATSGDRQGNLLLSRYPMAETGVIHYPKRVAGERRGLTWARIPTQNGDLLFAVTHFSAWADEEPDRLGQAGDLLAFWGRRPRTLVAGDLNCTPDTPAIQRLRDGGFTDLPAAIGLGAAPTFPAGRPAEHIDYLWSSPDISPVTGAIPATTASDHRPVVVEVQLR
jgi:endonuclease/exonuclease/phosphatase family metal-dependent hydrolase